MMFARPKVADPFHRNAVRFIQDTVIDTDCATHPV
jgi:hypothetical protein